MGIVLSLKHFFLLRNNHWMRRVILVFAFILFDYSSTLVFCHASYEEANMYARLFMESFGIPFGLTLFVFVVNLPIYITLCMDSHVIRLPFRIAAIAELFVDVTFAWFVAGLHFSGGTSWFWTAPDLMRNAIGALLYIAATLLLVKSYRPCCDS